MVRQYSDWEGFFVQPPAAGEDGAFRRMVQGLFPEGTRESTVLATLRTSGVAPKGWELIPNGWPWGPAWAGEAAFVLRAGTSAGRLYGRGVVGGSQPEVSPDSARRTDPEGSA